MKTIKCISIAITMFFSILVFGQESDSISIKKTFKTHHCLPTNKENEFPLIVIDNEIVSRKTLERIEPNTIENIYIIKGLQANALYGKNGNHGVIILKIKK